MAHEAANTRMKLLSKAGVVLLLVVVGTVSFAQAVKFDFDFHHFYLDAEYVWQHGQLNPDLDNSERMHRRQLPFYLPTVSVLLAPLAGGGRHTAAIIWALGQIAALLVCIRILTRWCRVADSRVPSWAPLLTATLLALPALYEAARFNQISFLVLALVLAGGSAIERRVPIRAGVWLGLATVFKLLPGLFVIWLVIKRQWTALGAMAVTVLIIAAVPPLIAFGPRDTLAYHRQWWNYNIHGSAARGMVDTEARSHFIDHRNQSIPAVMARLFWPEHPRRFAWQPITLTEQNCRRLSLALTLGLLVVLVWLTRSARITRAEDDLPSNPAGEEMRSGTAIYLIAMLVLSPLLRTYYLIWAWPGLVLIARQSLDERHHRAQRLGQIGLLVWTVGMLAWLSDAARAGGAHLIMLIALAAILIKLRKKESN